MPLRHTVFRSLWMANVVTALGTWMQNTGAGWLMTSLSPDALSVSLVQAATIFPVLLLALPAGALADTLDRRLFLIGTQVWTMCAAVALAGLTYAGLINATGLIALTFAIGMGSAMYQPAWGATVPEVVPRHDLVQAIALNGIGFNLARALGPALGGVLVLFGGPALAFSLYAVSFLASIAALLAWRRAAQRSLLPREHLLSAMRAGMRFARHTPAMQAAMLRAIAYFLPSAAPWALLPLIVREQLGLGAGSFGLLLGMMGVGGVTSGMLLPLLRGRAGRGATTFGSSLFSCAGMACIASSHHWALAGLGMMLFGVGWVAAASTLQAAAQLVAPPWVRARALGIYQLAFNGALAFGSMLWGWLGDAVGLQTTMAIAAVSIAALAVAVRGFSLDQSGASAARPPAPPVPEAPAPEFAIMLPQSSGRILETMRYRVPPSDREAFLQAMQHVQHARGRAGAVDWRLYEDVAHPEGWLEAWSMENWTDHLREANRLSEMDHEVLARVSEFHDEQAPLPCRYITVDPSQRTSRPARNAARLATLDGSMR
jgi:MFS family permease